MTRSSLEATAAFYGASPVMRLTRWGLGASQRLWPAFSAAALGDRGKARSSPLKSPRERL